MYAWRGRGGLGSLGALSIPDLIRQAAARIGVPSSIALSVAYTESRYRQSAVSPVGAIGVMQLMPGTASDLGVNPYDVNQNIDGGLTYLQKLYNQFGNWRLALQAYNGGPGHVLDGTISSAARSYADTVLSGAGSVPSSPVSTGGPDPLPAGIDAGAVDPGQGEGWYPEYPESWGDETGAGLSTAAKVSIGLALGGLLLVALSA